MIRYLQSFILKDLNNKIVILSGPRQSGKTTLSKGLFKNFDYLNYDNTNHRRKITDLVWNRDSQLIIFDELHKMKKWKSWVKGIYDVEGTRPNILITGSAKLDTYKKMGDSLAGRHFNFRLHPLDLKEISHFSSEIKLEDAFLRLMTLGGFPEPFFVNDLSFYRRWKKSHLDLILKQDLIQLENVKDIIGLENLIELLKTRVGGTISHNNLAQDLEVDPKTVKRWLDVLERLFIIFKVTPYSQKIRDSLLKAPKYYFYDIGQVKGDEGSKFENLVACALYKELQFIEDTEGFDVSLHYLRSKKGQEIDFLIKIDNRPLEMIEVKWGDSVPSKSFAYFSSFASLKRCRKTQLVAQFKDNYYNQSGVHVAQAISWLAKIDFLKNEVQ